MTKGQWVGVLLMVWGVAKIEGVLWERSRLGFWAWATGIGLVILGTVLTGVYCE